VLITRRELYGEAFWGFRLRGADIDTLSPDLQLRDSREGSDKADLKTKHMGWRRGGLDAARSISTYTAAMCSEKTSRPAVHEAAYQNSYQNRVLDRATAVAALLRDKRVRADCRRGVHA
jgi:hypothetical protein